MNNINWYPGHMKKTRELIEGHLKKVDLVLEVIDARIPVSSKNPVIDSIVLDKPRITVFNKADLSDPKETKKWLKSYREQGISAVAVNSLSGEGFPALYKGMEGLRDLKNKDRLVKRPFRIMVVGIPNVGKSSLINRLVKRKGTATGNRPGVTRGKQWLLMDNGMELLDTPGILWPKFTHRKTGLALGFLGSIKDEILDTENLALELIKELMKIKPEVLGDRYRIETENMTPLEVMEAIAENRGYLRKAEGVDYERTARTVLDEFRKGKLGRITLEPLEE